MLVLLELEFTVVSEGFNLAKVRLTEKSTITRLETPYGLIKRREDLTVPAEWALFRLKDSNLLFVFEESDRSGVETVAKEHTKLMEKLVKFTVTPKSLCEHLLPTKKKAGRPKKAPTPKKTVKAEKAE